MFKKGSRDLKTIVGSNTRITGELSAKGTIRIDGTVDGNIDADWIIIGESGSVRGNIRVRAILIAGLVEGNIDAEEAVELESKSRMSGEIFTSRLSIAEGAVFDGQSRMKEALLSLDAAEKIPKKIPRLLPPS